MADRNI